MLGCKNDANGSVMLSIAMKYVPSSIICKGMNTKELDIYL